MPQFSTVATGTLGQLTKQNQAITAELREQIRLTREAARAASGAGGGNPYVVPGSPAAGGGGFFGGDVGAHGMRKAEKLGKLGGEFFEKGLGALSSGRNIKEVLHEFIGGEVAAAAAAYVPVAFAAIKIGNFIAEKIVDHLIGSTEKEVEKIVSEGQRVDRQNAKAIAVEVRKELGELADEQARKELLKLSRNVQPANPEEKVAQSWSGGFGPGAHAEYTTKGAKFEEQQKEFLEGKKEEIEKLAKEKAEKLENMIVSLRQDSSLQYSAGISREAIIAKLIEEGKKLTEREIKGVMEEMIIQVTKATDAVHSALTEKIEKAKAKALQHAAEVDANPSLPCLEKQQREYMRKFEELQMNSRGDWSTY